MDQEHGPQYQPDATPEHLEQSVEAFELPETQEMSLLRVAALEALRTGEGVAEALGRFQQAGADLVDSASDERQRTHLQISLIILSGLMRYEAGLIDEANVDLKHAVDYADELGIGDEVDALIRAKIQKLFDS